MRSGAANILLTPVRQSAIASLKGALKPGQQVFSRVLQQMENNLFLMNLKGMQISAQTNTPLIAGEVLKLKVVQMHPKIVLKRVDNRKNGSVVSDSLFRKLLDNPELQQIFSEGNFPLEEDAILRVEEYLRQIKEMDVKLTNAERRDLVSLLETSGLEISEKNISKLLPLIRGFESFSVLFGKIAEMAKKIEAPENIKNLIAGFLKLTEKLTGRRGLLSPQELGLTREKLLLQEITQDSLKEILLRLLNYFRGKEEVFATLLSRAVQQLESLQLLHNLYQNHIEEFVFLPWVYAGEQQEFARINRYKESQEGNVEGAIYLRTTIHSQSFGDVQALFRLWRGRIDLDLIAPSKEIQKKLQNELSALEERLKTRGIPVERIRALTARDMRVSESGININPKVDVII